MKHYLNIGGLVAIGFDPTGKYMLTVSHSGRGLYRVGTWERLERDQEVAYPKDGISIGIGVLEGQTIIVTEIDEKTERLQVSTPDQQFQIVYAEGSIAIRGAESPQ